MTLYDFLSFRTMITPFVLLTVYYLGALLMPFFAYGLFRWFVAKYRDRFMRKEDSPETGFRWNWKLRMAVLFFFLMGELAWRIFIEFFVAYFQIRDALMG